MCGTTATRGWIYEDEGTLRRDVLPALAQPTLALYISKKRIDKLIFSFRYISFLMYRNEYHNLQLELRHRSGEHGIRRVEV